MLDYEDRELVELFGEFHTTQESEVEERFWEDNVDVIDETIQLLTQFKQSLVAIYRDRQSMMPPNR